MPANYVNWLLHELAEGVFDLQSVKGGVSGGPGPEKEEDLPLHLVVQ